MRKKETPNPSRVRGRGVEVSETLFYAENAQIIILFEIPGKGVAGRKGGQKE